MGMAPIKCPFEMSADGTSKKVWYNSENRHGVDDKRRVQIPSKWRLEGEVEYSLILWPKGNEPEACLLVLPPEPWLNLTKKLNEMSFADPTAVALRRLIGRKSSMVTPDKVGRICLPEDYAKRVGIEKDAVL